jgi:hypothetical protein
MFMRHYVLVPFNYYRQCASGQSHLCHPFIYGPPAPPLLSRTPIIKYIYIYIYHRVKAYSIIAHQQLPGAVLLLLKHGGVGSDRYPLNIILYGNHVNRALNVRKQLGFLQ